MDWMTLGIIRSMGLVDVSIVAFASSSSWGSVETDRDPACFPCRPRPFLYCI